MSNLREAMPTLSHELRISTLQHEELRDGNSKQGKKRHVSTVDILLEPPKLPEMVDQSLAQ